MRFFFIYLSLLILLFTGCGTVNKQESKNAAGKAVNIELSTKDSLKYKFVFYKALTSKYTGTLSEALQYFDYCRELNPSAPEPYYQMSLIADKIDEIKDALNYARNSIQLNPDNKWYRLHLANLYLRRDQLDSAIVQYENVVRLEPGNLDFIYRLANMYNESNEYEKALRYYNKIEEQVGRNKDVAIRKQRVYSNLGLKKKAINEIEKLIAQSPNDTRLYGILAELYASYNEYEKAEEMYSRLFEIDSTNNMGQISRIRFYQQNNKYSKAIEAYYDIISNESIRFGTKMLVFINLMNQDQKVLEYSFELEECLSELSEKYPKRNEIHTLYADLYLKLNSLDKAAKHLKILAYTDGTKYIYWEQLLSVYSFQGNFSELYRQGQKAISKFRKKPRLYFLTSLAANQMMKYDSAVYYLRQGLSFIPEEASDMKVDFYIQLAEAFHNKEAHKKSDRYFEKALKIQPNNQLVLNNYSYYLSLRNEKLEKALNYSERTIEKEPDNSVYLDTYAWILYKLGKYRKAERYIEKAINNGGHNDGDIIEHYGDILYKNGNLDEAVKQWEKAWQKGRDSEELEYKIKHRKLPE